MDNANKKVLVVDDENSIRDLLVEIMEIEGFDTKAAVDGADAIKKLEKIHFDIIITDLMMPRVDGLKVLEKAKSLYDDIVVLMMTGQATVESAVKSLQLGANDYITKPFDIPDMMNTVKKSLQTQELIRENLRLQEQTRKDKVSLRKLVAELTVLQNLGINFSYTFDYAQLIEMILDSIYEVVDYKFAATANVINKTIVIKAGQKLSKNNENWLRKTFLKLLKNAGLEEEEKSDFDIEYLNANKSSVISASVESNYPLTFKYEDQIFGILLVCHTKKNAFNDSNKRFLKKIATQASDVFNRLMNVIEQQRKKYQIMIDGIPDGVIILDTVSNKIIANPSARNMLMSDKPVSNDEIEKLLDMSIDNLKESLSKTGSINRELQLEKENGNQMIISANIANFSSESSIIQGVIMALRDITGEREIDRMKKEFISNVSHELRTPAAVVKEFISILNDEVSGPVNEEQRDYLNIMYQNIERLLRLIENLLNISRVEAGKIRLKKKKFNINKLLNLILPSLEIRLKKKNIGLKLEVNRELPEIVADSDALIQVITNIVDNARKFSAEKTVVEIGAVHESEYLKFWIKDQGRGIPKEHIDKIFDRFHRIEPENEARQEGAGLGLPIVKEIVALHNGKVWVESEAQKGSTFYFTIRLNEIDKVTKL